MANWLIRKVTGLPFRDFGCTMRVMRNEVAASMRIYGEMHRFIPVLAQQQGARMDAGARKTSSAHRRGFQIQLEPDRTSVP